MGRKKIEDVALAKFLSASDFAQRSKSEATQRAYREDWAAFKRWCKKVGCAPLPTPPETLARYLAELATTGRKVAGIERVLVSISQMHKEADIDSPRGSAPVRKVMAGIRRTLGTAQTQKSALVVEDLRTMLLALPEGLKGTRDRALLLLGFAGAFRRSELVALNWEDLEETPEGLRITVRQSKTDQERRGRLVGIPNGKDPNTCPLKAFKAWKRAAQPRGVATAVFVGCTRHGKLTGKRLHGKDVARVIKRLALRAGLDSQRLSGHSLRAGLATTAAKRGKSEHSIMKQTGHRSVGMVRRYIRDANLFADNAADDIGL